MHYFSTNGNSPHVSFREAVLKGQPEDKGLYFPEKIANLSPDFLKTFNGKSNEHIAFEVIKPYVGDSVPDETLFEICAETVSFPFPLVEISESISVLELFHGPTLAFKDVGARFMSRCLQYFSREKSGKTIVIVATSGDTGGAVASGFFGVEGVEVIILYPKGKVSKVQELQLTTLGGNVTTLELPGTFDDCQQLAKHALTDAELHKRVFITSANSINVARWLPQQFYYFYALKHWRDEAPVIAVPSGNFGNICAGLFANASGLAGEKFIAACNSNDVIPRFMKSGELKPRPSVSTLSNAMDVGNPSNFVRILEIFGKNFVNLSERLQAVSVSDEQTAETMREVYSKHGYILDPHGAVGFHALFNYLNRHPGQKGIFLETAHPVKFESVEKILGTYGEVPESVRELLGREKKTIEIGVNYEELRDYFDEGMKVLKFGGTSVGNAENIRKVTSIVQKAAENEVCVLVSSAMQGVTDTLIEAGRLAECGDDGFIEMIRDVGDRHFEVIKKLFTDVPHHSVDEFVEVTLKELENLCEGVFLLHELSPRTLDRVLSFGELVSTKILSAHLQSLGVENVWKDSRELIRSDSNFGFAAVDFNVTYSQIKNYFGVSEKTLQILPGFIASDKNGSTTTLGRGGSDYTAAILAGALEAESLEIWTDVSGMMTADPRFVRNVRQIPRITYREAMELSHFGAKVIYPPTIQPVMTKSIPVWIKNTFAPEDHGTLIEAESAGGSGIVRGITSIDDLCVLSLEGSGMVGIPGFSKRLFDALSRAQINVILITQSSSEHSICVAIEEKFGMVAKTVVDAEFEYEINIGKIEPLKVENGFSILALVGDNMKAHTGVSGKMFTTLGHNGINIHAIAQGSSERNISAIINSKDVRKAVNTLHEEFFSDGKKQINLYIAGVGTVGTKLIEQIRQQHGYLLENMRVNLRVIALANSKHLLFDEEGIALDGWLERMAKPALTASKSANEMAEIIIEKNLRNSIFVDVTASADVVEMYPQLLKKSVSVIACNKIACSAEYDIYLHLKELAREFGANFLFETNVGAGLPVINTLNDLMRSGDTVNRIEAVLSGTLNFVFNNYDGSDTFSEVVKQAQNEGYTEPDPRLDLSGTDVARKILILAREAGYKMELSDITNVSFLPETCLNGSVDDFYYEMQRHEDHFRKLLNDARIAGLSLKYIASFDKGKAEVGLQTIGPDHNLAKLSGKDNAVLFYTNRYSEQPLVIKGAGAGADVTAAGVFADIIRASRA